MALVRLNFLSILAVMSDLVTVVPVCLSLITSIFNCFDLGVMLMVSTVVFEWCGTALRVFLSSNNGAFGCN